MIINKDGLTIGKKFIIGCRPNGKTERGAERYNINIYDKISGAPQCDYLNYKGVIDRKLLKDRSFNVATFFIESYIGDLMEILDANL